MDKLVTSPRTRLKRHPERARDERAALHALIDEAWVCQLGVVVDGLPVVLPTMHVRLDDTLYVHGAHQNRQLHALCAAPSCISLSVLDGLVYAKRAFSHSMNYRSAVLFAQGTVVLDVVEKQRVLHALVERFGRGRADEVLPPSDAELASTLVVAVSLAEASLKARAGGPAPCEDACAAWTGVVPVRARLDLPDDALPRGAALDLTLASRADSYEVRASELSVSTRPERLDRAFVHAFLRDESYWAPGLDEEGFTRALADSLCFSLRLGERQIGFARVVLDGARFAYLADVFVVSEQRGRGYGKWLVEQVLAHERVARVQRVVLGTRDAHELYTRFGFQRAPNGVFMRRDR